MNEPLPKLDRDEVLAQEAVARQNAIDAEATYRDAQTLVGLEQALRGEGKPLEQFIREMEAKFPDA